MQAKSGHHFWENGVRALLFPAVAATGGEAAAPGHAEQSGAGRLQRPTEARRQPLQNRFGMAGTIAEHPAVRPENPNKFQTRRWFIQNFYTFAAEIIIHFYY